jgi:hypothetical protein
VGYVIGDDLGMDRASSQSDDRGNHPRDTREAAGDAKRTAIPVRTHGASPRRGIVKAAIARYKRFRAPSRGVGHDSPASLF